MSEISSPEVDSALENYHNAMRDGTEREIRAAEAALNLAQAAIRGAEQEQTEDDS